jgi:AmmeMemoRadiSam system protein B
MIRKTRNKVIGPLPFMLVAPIVIVLVLGCLTCPSAMAGERIRKPAVAGYFYPNDRQALRQTVDALIANVTRTQVGGSILGIVCPHAGYVYSGQAAAYSYREIMGRPFDTVIILGPSHRSYLRGASVGDWDAYETPLGRVPVNREIVSAFLEKKEPFCFLETAHTGEHSIEVQLPFLQRTLRNFDIVPIVMGLPSLAACKEISRTLASIAGDRRILFVASSDMSHFPDYEHANEVDKETLSLIEKLDPDLLFTSEETRLSKGIPNLSTTLCGLRAVVTVMMTVKELGGNTAKVLHYTNSGDVAIDGHKERRRVVGYGAVAFYK